jgi:CHAT domain-containing protein
VWLWACASRVPSSDLAAAAYTASLERGGDPARLTEALAASEKALQLDAQFLEALFNRALILERLGLGRQAREAWDRYLSADPRSNWAAEAKRHRGTLTPGPDGARALPSTPPSVLHTAAQKAAHSGEWLNALQLLDRALDERRTAEQGELTAELLLMRAFIEARLGLPELARQHLARARPAIEDIADAAIRSRLASASTAVEAILARSPSSAVEMLRAPLEAGNAPGEILAQMHLQRGRSFATLGRLEKAAADFDAGIGRIEQASPAAWNTAVTRTDLYDAAVELALSRGELVRAFTYAERRRTPHAARVVQVAASGTGTEIFVEYELIGTSLVIFSVKDGRIHAARRAVEPGKLESLIADLSSGATTHSMVLFRRAAAELYEQLIDPVATDLEPGRKLVFIPDHSLQAIPFAALVGPTGRYLVEDHAVVVATSATTYASLSARSHAPATGPLDLLVVAGPSRNDALGPLFGVQREAIAVARPYRRVTRIGYDGKALESYAASADVIHFAGHALVAEDDAAGALVVLDAHGEIGRMDTRQIASLRLRHARLVVLAACNTAVGLNNGTRTSVAEAFLTAGAPSVIGTVWEISDEAASDFFPRLHSHFANGASAADALRAAQLETIRRGNVSPATWAAVQVIGS